MCVCVHYTLHSDEGVSLLILGCEIVVYSVLIIFHNHQHHFSAHAGPSLPNGSLPSNHVRRQMTVTFYVLVLNCFDYIDVNPRILLVSVLKKAKQILIWLKKILIFSQIG